MNIYAKRFDKVVYLNRHGYDADRDYANKFLIKGNEYTVNRINVGQSSSQVELIECPNNWFNTVMFKDVVDVIGDHFLSNGSDLAKTVIEGESQYNLSKVGLNTKKSVPEYQVPAPKGFTGDLSEHIQNVHDDIEKILDNSKLKAVDDVVADIRVRQDRIQMANLKLNPIDPVQDAVDRWFLFGEIPRNPMNQPVFTPPRSKNDWSLNMEIPHRTVDKRNAFDDYFTITGLLTYTVLKQKDLKFNHFDWCQLHNITVSKRIKHGRWIETTVYHVLAWREKEKSILICELKSKDKWKN